MGGWIGADGLKIDPFRQHPQPLLQVWRKAVPLARAGHQGHAGRFDPLACTAVLLEEQLGIWSIAADRLVKAVAQGKGGAPEFGEGNHRPVRPDRLYAKGFAPGGVHEHQIRGLIAGPELEADFSNSRTPLFRRGGVVVFEAIPQIAQSFPGCPRWSLAAGSKGRDLVPRSEPSGGKIPELTGKILVDQQQMHPLTSGATCRYP